MLLNCINHWHNVKALYFFNLIHVSLKLLSYTSIIMFNLVV